MLLDARYKAAIVPRIPTLLIATNGASPGVKTWALGFKCSWLALPEVRRSPRVKLLTPAPALIKMYAGQPNTWWKMSEQTVTMGVSAAW